MSLLLWLSLIVIFGLMCWALFIGAPYAFADHRDLRCSLLVLLGIGCYLLSVWLLGSVREFR